MPATETGAKVMAVILEFPTDVCAMPQDWRKRQIQEAERQRNHDQEYLAYLESCGCQNDQKGE